MEYTLFVPAEERVCCINLISDDRMNHSLPCHTSIYRTLLGVKHLCLSNHLSGSNLSRRRADCAFSNRRKIFGVWTFAHYGWFTDLPQIFRGEGSGDVERETLGHARVADRYQRGFRIFSFSRKSGSICVRTVSLTIACLRASVNGGLWCGVGGWGWDRSSLFSLERSSLCAFFCSMRSVLILFFLENAQWRTYPHK